MPSLTSHSSLLRVSVPLIEKFMLLHILFVTFFGVAPSGVLICRGVPPWAPHSCRSVTQERAPTEGRPYKLGHYFAPSLVRAQQPESYKSPDGILRVVITTVSKSCPEDRLVIRNHNGALFYRKDFSSSDCEHGDNIVRGEWSPDSQFFVFNVESTGGHQPGHRPVFFYSRSENKLYRLENYIGYIVAQDFTLEAPHIIKTEKQKIIGEMEGVPIKVDLSQILRRKVVDGEPNSVNPTLR